MKLATWILAAIVVSLTILMIVSEYEEKHPKKKIKKSTPVALVPVDKVEENDSIKDLINAMIIVESTGNDSAVNHKTNAVGCLQIRPIMVRDVNRIIKKHGGSMEFFPNDRYDRLKSLAMFFVWKSHYHSNSTLEKIARCWNGGVNGDNNPKTEKYWKKIKSKL
jgi:hypothetical protein